VLTGPHGASVTNLAFGGPGRKTLFCTDSTHGHVLKADMAVAGAQLHTGP
jgi:gluconolactonase